MTGQPPGLADDPAFAAATAALRLEHETRVRCKPPGFSADQLDFVARHADMETWRALIARARQSRSAAATA